MDVSALKKVYFTANVGVDKNKKNAMYNVSNIESTPGLNYNIIDIHEKQCCKSTVT